MTVQDQADQFDEDVAPAPAQEDAGSSSTPGALHEELRAELAAELAKPPVLPVEPDEADGLDVPLLARRPARTTSLVPRPAVDLMSPAIQLMFKSADHGARYASSLRLSSQMESINRMLASIAGSQTQRLLRDIDWPTVLGPNLNVVNRLAAGLGTDRVVGLQLAAMDGLLPKALFPAQTQLAARAAQMFASGSALDAWRTSVVSVDLVELRMPAVEQMLRTIAATGPVRASVQGLLDDLTATSAGIADVTRWAAEVDPGRSVLRGRTAPVLRAWNVQLRQQPADDVMLTEDEVRDELIAEALGGHAVAGLLGAEVGLAPPSVPRRDEGLALTEQRLLVPARTARDLRYAQLRDRLGRLDPSVPAALDGAWEELGSPTSFGWPKLSLCIEEALSRTLRALSPEDKLRAWYDLWTPKTVVWEYGKTPTRALRIRFVARAAPREDRQLLVRVDDQLTRTWTALTEKLQRGKHGGGDMMTAESLLHTAEALLTLLLLALDEDREQSDD